MTQPAPAVPSLLVFGGGYLGLEAAREAIRRGGRALATSRDPVRRTELTAAGVLALDPADAAARRSLEHVLTKLGVPGPGLGKGGGASIGFVHG